MNEKMIRRRIKQKMGPLLVVIILVCSILFSTILLGSHLTTVQAGSTWIQTSDKDFYNGTFENITMVGIGDDTELRIIQNHHSWTKRTHTSGPSFRRYCPLATIYGTDKIMLFGGYGDYIPPTHTSRMRYDTWVYDQSDNNWSDKSPVSFPPPRERHGLASIDGDDKVLLYGGYNSETRRYLNDTWVYDLSQNTWTEKAPENTPGYLFNHAISTIYGTDKIFLYGGGWSGYRQTWVYDLSRDNWTRMYPNTNPGDRGLHAMAPVYGTDKVILFGGSTSLEDTWVYDLSENNWTVKLSNTKSGGRFEMTLANIHGSDKVVVFSGTWANDSTWIYDLSQDEWTSITLVNQSKKPGPGFDPNMATVWGTNKVVLYGTTYSYYDDTWIYTQNLSIRNGTYISEPFDTHANSSFYKISWNASTPVNTSIKLQLRSGTEKSDLAATSFVGPNGAASTYYTVSPMDIWSGHSNDRWIQYKIFFNHNLYSDPPVFIDAEITYNCLPTMFAVSPNNGARLTDNKPTFTWSFNDYDSPYQNAFQVLIDRDIKFTSVDFDSGEQHSSNQQWEFPFGTNYDILPEGSWYWKVRTCDDDGVWTEYCSPRLIIIDTNQPFSKISWPITNGFYQDLNTISGTATDPTNGSGVVKVDIAIKKVRDNSYWDGFKWVQFETWLPTTGTSEWTFDSGKIYWTSGMKYSIQTRATDNASNIEQPSDSKIFTIDTDSPLSNIEIPANNVWLNNLNNISGGSIDKGGSEIEKVEINIKCVMDELTGKLDENSNNYWNGKEWSSVETWLPASGLNYWFFDSSAIPWSTGMHYLIHSRASDKVGNIEVPTTGNTFIYDSTSPEATSIYINHGEEYTLSNHVILSLQAEDVGSGVAQMAFSMDNEEWSDFEPYNTTKELELPAGDGEKTIFFRVKDYTENIAETIFDTIILDTEPPEELTIVINDNKKYTNSNTVLLDLSANDKFSGLNQMSFNYNGLAWTTSEPFATKKTLSLPMGDGEKVIYFRVTDVAGNNAKPVSDSIILDTTPPQSLSIDINGGALETRSTRVFLELNAEDSLSGVDKISFSIDNETWSSWEEYSKIKYYNLPSGEGMKTIYFRAKDWAGNTADPVAETIFLNTTPLVTNAPEKTAPSEETDYFPFIIIFIIILIAMTALWFVISMKRMKRLEQKLLPAAITVKPVPLPGTSVISEQVSAGPMLEMLPETASSNDTAAQQPTISVTPTPKLAKTTLVTTPEAPTPATTHPQLPQLPPAPAMNDAAEPEVEEIEPTPSTIVTPTLVPTPTIQTPTEPSPENAQQPQEQGKEQKNSEDEDTS
jgi:hypothetical protein